MFSTILVCLDRSGFSEQVLPYAEEMAQRFGSRLVLLTVIELSPPAGPEFPEEMDLVETLRREEAQRYIEGVAAQLRQKGLPVEAFAIEGPTAHTIVEHSTTHGVELIIMGTHGRKNIGRLVFGSVTDHVLRHSSIPVLAIKPQTRSAPQ